MTDPADISKDIEATRRQIDDTLDALTDRLSPHRLLSRAGRIGRETLAQTSLRMQRNARENPVVLGLSAAAVLILALGVRRAVRGALQWGSHHPLALSATSAAMGAGVSYGLSHKRTTRRRVS
jgi:Protein of unknown function (DUF3618)